MITKSIIPNLTKRVRPRVLSHISLFCGLAALSCLLAKPASAQGLETFDNSNATTTYADNSFTGNGGIFWNYVHSRDAGTYEIDGSGLMLRRAAEPSSLSANIPGGIGDFSVDTRKAFTGNAPRKIELVINGSVVSQFEPTFGSGADTTVAPFVVNDIDVAGTVALELRVYGDGAQITLDNLSWTGFGIGPVDPALFAPTVSDIQATEATLSAQFFPNDGADFTEYGFVVSESAVNAAPSIGDLDADWIDFPGTPTNPIQTTLTGLTPETEYAVRAYVIYASGAETLYSDPTTTFTTLAPPEPAPSLDGVTDYTQDFSGFVSSATLPTGWSVTSDGFEYTTYEGDWGTGFSNGLRGNANVLGLQHTGSTGVIAKTLTLTNNTGAEITDLFLSYVGRVERITENRNPIYSITVDGVAVPTISYDTLEGDAVNKASVASGLNIPDGANFEIVWTSELGGTSGSSKQIGISNVQVSLDLPSDIAPTLLNITFPDPVEFPVTATGFSVDSGLLDAGSDPVTAVGFVIAETALQANPAVGDANTTVIDLTTTFDPDFSLIFYDFAGLTPGTSYSVRSFATSAAGTSYSAAITQATLSLPASLTAAGYDEDFLGFTGVESLPAGWSVVGASTSYGGDWGAGSSAGFRGPEVGATVGVVGYQHTRGSGTITLNLEMTNDTGAEINALEVSYLGRVERTGETRLPIWTVEIDGVEVPALSYSTGAGIDQTVSTTVTGLSIASGATFTISWSSDRGEPSGSSRQIGLADVTVDSVSVDVTPPVLDLAPGTYFEDQTVFVSNFASLGTGVEVRYTLDGSDPAAGVGSLYADGTGILIEDGNGPVQLRAVAVDTGTSEVSPIVSETYTLPVNVADIAAFRSGTPGTLYRITGEAVVLHRNSFRNRHFVQDASGSLTIWDNNSPNLITTDYAVGDGVTGFVGTLNTVNNGAIISLQAANDPGAATSSENPVVPTVVTIDSLDLSLTGALVRINGVSIDETGDFANGQNYDISDSTGSSLIRTDFFNADYIGTPFPASTVDLVGIVGGFGANAQITPRDLADLIEPTPPSGSPLGDYLTQRSLTEADLEIDTNSNGLTVLEEYFFGIDDGVGSDSKLLGVDVANSALTLVSDLQADPDGVSVQLLATSDLTAAFAPVAFTVSSAPNGDGTFTRSYTETTPPAQATNRFYRLSLTVDQ